MTEKTTTTIHEHFAANPNVDNSEIFDRFWAILTRLRDRLAERFSFTRHEACAGREYYQVPDGSFEGSLNAYTGPEIEWFVHSWIGNRKNSILDMNINVWLGPQIDVPHLSIVFGTIPKLFHYSDLLARRDLMTEIDYLRRYYEPHQQDWLQLRGDPRFLWSVSHGAYMRAILSPCGSSFTAERETANIDALEAYVEKLFARWLSYVDAATPVPPSERAALRARDHFLRESIYRLDPMNALAQKFLGPELTEALVTIRYGKAQIEATR
jgi:hypothetical protein